MRLRLGMSRFNTNRKRYFVSSISIGRYIQCAVTTTKRNKTSENSSSVTEAKKKNYTTRKSVLGTVENGKIFFCNRIQIHFSPIYTAHHKEG